jgi:hypothetical protein
LLDKETIANLLRIPADHFNVICEKDDVLSEVRVCWRFEKVGGIYDLPCQTVQNETIYPLVDTCPKSFKLLAFGKYGKKHQKRVTRHCNCPFQKKARKQQRKQCLKNCRALCKQ